MTDELKELRQHVRWLEDAVERHLDDIDGRIDEINDVLKELIRTLAPNLPPPVIDFFETTNGRKEKPKLAIVPKDDDRSPGDAS